MHAVEIPAGWYEIGNDSIPNASPRHGRQVDRSYWIDAFPVCWAHFEVFVSAGYPMTSEPAGRDEATVPGETSVDSRCQDLLAQMLASRQSLFGDTISPRRCPLLGVTWFEASALAQFCGGRLPYEAEWEIAMSTSRSSTRQSNDDAFPHCPVSRWGCRTMIGTLQEWTADSFSPRYWRADFQRRGNLWSPERGDSGVVVRSAGPHDVYRHVSFRFGSRPDEVHPQRGLRRVWDSPPSDEQVNPRW